MFEKDLTFFISTFFYKNYRKNLLIRGISNCGAKGTKYENFCYTILVKCYDGIKDIWKNL